MRTLTEVQAIQDAKRESRENPRGLILVAFDKFTPDRDPKAYPETLFFRDGQVVMYDRDISSQEPYR